MWNGTGAATGPSTTTSLSGLHQSNYLQGPYCSTPFFGLLWFRSNSCSQTCTKAMNFSKRYPCGLHVRIQMSESVSLPCHHLGLRSNAVVNAGSHMLG